MQLAGAALLVPVAVSLVAAAAATLAPGRWQSDGVVTAAEMPGMPAEALAALKKRPISHSHCLTPEAAEDGARGLFSEGSGSCEYTKFSMSEGRINAVLQCKGPQGSSQLTMVGRYDATSYTTTNILVIGGPQGAMRMTTRMTGKRVGGC